MKRFYSVFMTLMLLFNVVGVTSSFAAPPTYDPVSRGEISQEEWDSFSAADKEDYFFMMANTGSSNGGNGVVVPPENNTPTEQGPGTGSGETGGETGTTPPSGNGTDNGKGTETGTQPGTGSGNNAGNGTGTEVPVDGEDNGVTDPNKVDVDYSTKTITGGYYVEVNAPVYSDSTYVPTVEFELWDDKTNKLVSKATADSSNYNKDKGAYIVRFENKGFKLGDILNLRPVKMDKVVNSIEVGLPKEGMYVATLKNNQYAELEAIRVVVDTVVNGAPKSIASLYGAKDTPVVATMKFNDNVVVVKAVDTKGVPIPKLKLTVRTTDPDSKKSFNVTTDANGLLFLDKSKLTDSFYLQSDTLGVKGSDNGLAGLELYPLPSIATKGVSGDYYSYTVAFDPSKTSAQGYDAASTGSVTVNFSVKGTSINDSWHSANIEFTKAGVSEIRTVSASNNKVFGLSDGVYTVTAPDNDTKKVTLSASKITVTNGKATLGVTVESKYALIVKGKDSKYSFTMPGVSGFEGKKISGTGSVTYAVQPGTTVTVIDDATGVATTAYIEEGKYTTTITLGEGVTSSKGDGTFSNPHTADTILIWLVVLIVSGVGFFYLYRQRKLGKTSMAKTLMLVLLSASLATPFIPAKSVFAGIDGGQPGNISGGPSKAGTMQVSRQDNLLRAKIVISDALQDTAKKTDLADLNLFDDSDFFYMAPNATLDAKARNSESGLGFYYPNAYTVTYGSSMKGHIIVPVGYGKDPIFDHNKSTSNSEFTKYLLNPPNGNTANGIQNVNSRGYFAYMMEKVLYDIAPGDSARNIITEGGQGVGSNVRKFFDNPPALTEAQKKKVPAAVTAAENADPAKNKGLQVKWLIMDDYTTRMGMDKAKFEKAFTEQKLSFIFESVVGSYSKGESQSNILFVPYNDMVQMYMSEWEKAYAEGGTGRNPSGKNAAYQNEAVVDGVTYAAASTATFKAAKLYNHMSSTFRAYGSTGYNPTMYPVSKNVTSSNNPFGGWGFEPFGAKIDDDNGAFNPTLKVQYDVTVYDADGKQVKHFQQPVPGYGDGAKSYKDEEGKSYSSAWRISDLSNSFNGQAVVISGPGIIENNGTPYKIMAGDSKVTLEDLLDKEQLQVTGNKLKVGSNKTSNKTIPVEEGKEWEVIMGLDTPSAENLNEYLGGYRSLSDETKDKYYNAKKEPFFSNALMTVYLKVQETKTVQDKDPIGFVVPEWRLSRYWSEVHDNTEKNPDGRVVESMFNLSLPIETYEDPSLSPSGIQYFGFKPVNVPEWALSKSNHLYRGDTQNKPVTLDNTYNTFWQSGDMLAVKENTQLSNIKFANWINPITFLGKIGNSNVGVSGGQAKTTKSFTFNYEMSNSTSYTYSETRYRDVWGTDAKGNAVIIDRVPYRWSGPASPSFTPSQYPTDVTFMKYNPTKGATPKTFEDKEEDKNGRYTFSEKSATTLSVFPEVLMFMDDANGNTSMGYVAGSEKRTMQPINYSVAQFKDITVDPSVVGASTATDSKAKSLGKSIGVGDKDIVYKGSTANVNFSNTGDYEIKSWLLDIGQSSLKTAWNPSGSIDTDAVHKKNVEKFAKWDSSKGNYVVEFSADGKFYINGKDEAGVDKKVKAEQASADVKTHKIIIRSGVVQSVDDIPLAKLLSTKDELSDALRSMRIIADNSADTIFNQFESNARTTNAADLSSRDSALASMGNAARGNSDLAVGKPWYNEDTTVLVIREYTNSFKIPSYMYVDKLPMSINGLQANIDKQKFFSKGFLGYTSMKYKNVMQPKDSWLDFNSVKGTVYWDKEDLEAKFKTPKVHQFGVADVSIMDTFGSE